MKIAKKPKKEIDIEAIKTEEFWATYELLFTALLYDLGVAEDKDDDYISDVIEGMTSIIAEVHDKRMSLQQFKTWVKQETGIPVHKIFEHAREGKTFVWKRKGEEDSKR